MGQFGDAGDKTKEKKGKPRGKFSLTAYVTRLTGFRKIGVVPPQDDAGEGLVGSKG